MDNSQNKKLWGGRFSGSASSVTEKISASVQYDSRLFRQDIKGSTAHAAMLCKIGILTEDERDAIVNGLREIEKEIESGTFQFRPDLEDIHMNIEAALTEKIGDAGRKLHTARSRNDQVAVDMRLYIKEESLMIEDLLKDLILLLVNIAEKNIDVLIPGYTHLQVAQPVRFGHHMLAYAWKLLRDKQRLAHASAAADSLPLGVGAMAGVNYPNDREMLRKELGFEKIILNSMDAVSDRDFMLDFLYFGAVLGAHLSRFCEELILWSSSEFDYIRLGDSVTTGSSIMPQKRNPDIAELIRGKTGRVYGNLFALLTTLKGLPMTYNRDMQEDKEPLFDTVDTISLALAGMIEMLSSMEVKAENMRKAVYSNFSTATDLADYLAKKGVPFRKSHEIVGGIVRYCEDTGVDFFSLGQDDLKKFSPVFESDICDVLDPEKSTERKESIGSTAKKELLNQMNEIKKELSV